jgi:hypothetical protein
MGHGYLTTEQLKVLVYKRSMNCSQASNSIMLCRYYLTPPHPYTHTHTHKLDHAGSCLVKEDAFYPKERESGRRTRTRLQAYVSDCTWVDSQKDFGSSIIICRKGTWLIIPNCLCDPQWPPKCVSPRLKFFKPPTKKKKSWACKLHGRC